MEKDDKQEKRGQRPNQEITVQVATPNGRFQGRVSTSITIESLITTIRTDKKIEGDETFELWHDKKMLEPIENTLQSFDLEEGVLLKLLAYDGGV